MNVSHSTSTSAAVPSGSVTGAAASMLGAGPHVISSASSVAGLKRGHSRGGRNLSQILSDLPLPRLFTRDSGSHLRSGPSVPSNVGEETGQEITQRKRLVRKVTRKGSLRNDQTPLKRSQPSPHQPLTSPAQSSPSRPSRPARPRPMSTLLWEQSRETSDEEVGSVPANLENTNRARLAKLRRHLGEDIPPSLISTPTTTSVKRSQVIARESLRVTASSSSLARSKSLRSEITQHRAKQPSQLPEARSSSLDFEMERAQSKPEGRQLAIEPLPASAHATSSLVIVQHEKADVHARLRANSVASVSGASSVEISTGARGVSSGPSRRPPLPRRPTTADTTSSESYVARARRERKLAKFFGVEYEDLSETHLLDADGLKFLRSAGTLTVPSADSNTQTSLDFDQPNRFWHFVDGRGVMKQANTEDVMMQLRAMRAR